MKEVEKMEIKDRILAGAQELFFKFGIKSITMDDIAKHLAVSKKTIYHCFDDKNELVETLMSESLKKDETEFKHINSEAVNVIEEVLHLMKHMSMMFTKVNPNLFYDMQKYHPGAWQMFKSFKEDCMAKMVENAIERGIREGLVRTDVNAKILAKLRIEQVEMGFNPAIFPPDKFKIVEVQVTMLDHFLLGICTIKGHKLFNKYKEVTEDE